MSVPPPGCPRCGGSLRSAADECPACAPVAPVAPVSPPALSGTSAPETSAPRPNWLLFFAVLLLPSVLTLATAKVQDLWPFFTFVVGGGCALFCGIWLARVVCRTWIIQVLVGLCFAVGCYILSFFLCCAGCALGGVNLNIH